MRIVLASTAPQWGGNEKWALSAASGLTAKGHDVTVLWSRGRVGRELVRRGLRRRRALFVNGWNPIGLVSLTLCLLLERPDAVVLTRRHEYLAGALAARAADALARLPGLPAARNGSASVSGASRPGVGRRVARTAIALRLGLRRRLRDDFAHRKAFGELADLVIVNSQSIKGELRSTDWLDEGVVRVLLNGVEQTSVSAFAGRAALASMGVAPGSPVVAAAGRLNRQKGFDVLIDAVAHVRREFAGAVLVIMGEGRRRRSLEVHAAGAGLGEAVVFAGERADVREILAAVDIYVLSSRNEGMANTLLEAMSVGAPIVATDVAGTREAVRDGVDALIVPPDDPDALAEAVLTLLRDAALSARLGSSALGRAREHFRLDRMVDELEAMLIEAISRCD
jgi:glycosyltransferase involved in cell wall biosynthesis